MTSPLCGIIKTKQMSKRNKTEAEPWTQRTNWWFPEEEEGVRG